MHKENKLAFEREERRRCRAGSGNSLILNWRGGDRRAPTLPGLQEDAQARTPAGIRDDHLPVASVLSL